MNKKFCVTFSLLFFLVGVNVVVIAQQGDIFTALSLDKENMKSQTGVYTLEKGAESLLSRLWLFDHAQASIDIQYFSFKKDVTGRIASDHIVQAANRGVKIRILLDDAASKMYSYQIQLLESHENIEVRVYNAGIHLGRLDRRVKFLIKNKMQIMKRMHNKTMTVDHQICVMGGRNIADEYFDFSHKYNFRDRDVLLAGEAVKSVNASFEKFWNDKRTVPYSQLSTKNKKWYNDPNRFERLHKQAQNSKKFSDEMRKEIDNFPDEIRKAGESKTFLWIPGISFVSDEPGKNAGRNKKGGTCTDSILNLVRQAKISIVIQSPYFILTKEYEQVFREAVQRGVKVRLLTNSLAAIDLVPPFSWYKKDRKRIQQLGIDIYEFKPAAQVRFKLMSPEVQSKLNYKPVFGFHSKTMIIDGNTTSIGSFNFDPRSANYNMECISIIRSSAFAKNISFYVEEEFLPENSWHTSSDYDPDSHAPMKKRIKVFFGRLLPKKYL
jgi:cardiolipin synthase C